MANSSSFDVRNLKARHGRNKHDLSYRNVFSTKFGVLTPFLVQDVVAGSSVQISLEHQTRTMPMVRPAFARLREHYDYFFVPYSQLYHAYDNFKTQQTNQRSALMENQFPSVVSVLPTFTSDSLKTAMSGDQVDAAGFNAGKGFMRIGDLLGYGCYWPLADGTSIDKYFGVNDKIYYNFFRLAAYQKIYFDYYRNDKYEPNISSYYNLDDLANGANIGSTRLRQLGLIHYRWRKKDYFMQVTPDVVPTLNQFARTGFPSSVTTGLLPSGTGTRLSSQFGINNGGVGASVTNANPLPAPESVNFYDNDSVGGSQVFPYNNVGGQQSVAQHRFASARQKLLERMYAAKSDFSSQMLAVYGIAPIEGRNGSVSHIGGFSEVLCVGDVENNTANYTASPYGGKVNNFGGTKKFKYKALEDGIIMGIYSTSMEADYCSDRIDRFNFKRVPEDYYIPEYETLGKQPLFSVEYQGHYLYETETASNLSRVPMAVIGFVPRYDEYRSHPDEVHLSGGPGIEQIGVLQGYTAPLNAGLNSGNWFLSHQHMIYKPSQLDSLFGVQAGDDVDTDQFLCNFYNDVKVISPLKVRSEL